MRALVKTALGTGNLSLWDRPIPVPGPGEVRIKVNAVGICGTDLHIWKGEYPCNPPVTLGHEVSGIIDAVGENVPEFEPGMPVVTETYFYTCGSCRFCASGHQNLCMKRRSIGSGADGGMAEYLLMPAGRVHPLPARLSFEEGAMLEPFICCVQAVFGHAKPQASDVVLVSGPGLMGLCCAQLLHAAGCRVLVSGLSKDSSRLELARKLGADGIVIADSETFEQDVRDFCGSQGITAAFECSGAAPSIAACVSLTQKGSVIVQVALPSHPHAVDLSLLAIDEKRLVGTFATTPVWWEKGLSLMGHDPSLSLLPMMSGTFPLTEWATAFETAASGQGFKYLLKP